MRWPPCLALLALFACGGDAPATADAGTTSAADGGPGDAATSTGNAPANLDGARVTFDETGGPTSEWSFPAGAGTTGIATLVGTGPFPFTYAKTGPSRSRLVFDVQGMDQYEMTWGSELGGSFQEAFNGTPGTSGTFSVSR